MKRVLGGLLILMGLALGAWVGYALLVEKQTGGQESSPLPALAFCAGLLFVGQKWFRE